MTTLRTIVVLLSLMAYKAHACSPTSQASLAQLKLNLGIEPTDQDASFSVNGQTDDFIKEANELNCDFSDPMSCQWKNMENSNDSKALDQADFYMFKKSDLKKYPWQVTPNGYQRTPEIGETFLLGGSDGNSKASAVLLSSPIKCTTDPVKFSFTVFFYSASKARVILLEPLSLGELGFVYECPKKDGVCSTEIPAQEQPFIIAIHTYDHFNSFVIVDDIKLEGDLGIGCGGDPYDFGTKSSTFASGDIIEPIETDHELQCFSWDQLCRWEARSEAGDVSNPAEVSVWQKHQGSISEDERRLEMWKEVTGKQDTPDEDFLMVVGKGKDVAILESALIGCQPEGVSGLATFQAWMSAGTRLRVCLVDGESLIEIACETLERAKSESSFYEVELQGPIVNKRIALHADSWNDGEGGFVAIDNLVYTAVQCNDEQRAALVVTEAEPESNVDQRSIDDNGPNDHDHDDDDHDHETGAGAPPDPFQTIPQTSTFGPGVFTGDVTMNLTDGSFNECSKINCGFDDGDTCGYAKIDPFTMSTSDTEDNSTTPDWALRRGVFMNRVTGVLPRHRNNEDEYIAVYLTYGQVSDVSVNVELQAPRVIAFNYYGAAMNMHMEVCCDNECSHASEPTTPRRDEWPEGFIVCPKGTQKIIFSCRNNLPINEQLQIPGACALDNIRLYKTSFDGTKPKWNQSSYKQSACPQMKYDDNDSHE